jgi:hypothetical protein
MLWQRNLHSTSFFMARPDRSMQRRTPDRALQIGGRPVSGRCRGAEGRRLAQLRHHQSKHPNKPIPANLTTPVSPH